MSEPTLCLINPPHEYLVDPLAQAPLGLLYVAASARDRGIRVKYVDLSAKHCKDISSADLPLADIYGITGTVLDRKGIHSVANVIRRDNPHLAIVVGGPITISRDMLDHSLIDAFVVGEGEHIIMDVIRDWPRLKKVYQAGRIWDLDSLPFPARDLIKGSLGGSVFVNLDGESTVISTSRGCSSACHFCSSPTLWKRKLVYRNSVNVVREIRHVVDKHKVNQFRFSDDNVTTNKNKFIYLCDAINEMDIAWRASIRVLPNDPRMFEAMKKAGCMEVSFGVESVDPNVLEALGKRISPEDSKTAIKNAKEAGLDVRILFMTGTPGMTNKTVDIETKFLDTMSPYYDAVALTNFVPLPGTKVYDDPAACGCEILDRDIDNYSLCFFGPDGEWNTWRNLVRPVAMSINELTSEKLRMRKLVEGIGKLNRG